MRAVSFKTRLLAGTLTLVLGFVVTAMVALTTLIGEHTERQVAHELEQDHTSYATWLELKCAALRERAEHLSQFQMAAAVGTGDPATAADVLRDVVGDRGLAVALADTHGHVLASTIAGVVAGADVALQPGLAQALDGVVCDRLWRMRRPVLVALSPILQGDAIVGVLAVGEAMDARTAAAIATFTGRDVTVLMLAEHAGTSTVHAHVRSGHPAPGDAAALPAALARAAEQRTDGDRIDVTVGDERHVGIVVPLHADGGSLLLSRDLGEVDALARAARRWLWAAGIGIAVFGVAFSLHMARRLSRPLRELTDATAQMTMGELQVRVRVERPDEIGFLGASFNLMAERIGALIKNVSAHAERAEAASRAKDRFLSSMSHELRTPITSIKAATEILQQFGAEAAAPECSEFLDIIGHESDRLAYIVGQVLDFTQLASGQADLQSAEVDVDAALQEAVAAVRGRADAGRVRLRLDLATPVRVRGDAQRLHKLAGALLRNAVQFAPPTSEVVVTSGPQGDAWQLTVDDRGPGIPDAVKEAVFESFYQHGDVLTAKPEGPGLGLTIARAIAVAHGGSVWCEDNPDGGARFVVRLPASDRHCAGRPVTVDVEALAPLFAHRRGEPVASETAP